MPTVLKQLLALVIFALLSTTAFSAMAMHSTPVNDHAHTTQKQMDSQHCQHMKMDKKSCSHCQEQHDCKSAHGSCFSTSAALPVQTDVFVVSSDHFIYLNDYSQINISFHSPPLIRPPIAL